MDYELNDVSSVVLPAVAGALRNVGRRKMAPMYMQDKYHKARGVIYSIGLAVLAILLAWKFIVR